MFGSETYITIFIIHLSKMTSLDKMAASWATIFYKVAGGEYHSGGEAG